MTDGRDEDVEKTETLPYAREVKLPWTRFQLSVAVACVLALLFLGTSTAELLYCIPGERYLFGQDSDIGYLGLAASLASPILLVFSFLARKRAVVTAAVCLIALAIVWTARVFVLLSYL